MPNGAAKSNLVSAQGPACSDFTSNVDGLSAAKPVDPEAEALRGGETILLVEDDAQVIDLVTIQMEPLGYRVLAAGNGPDALKILAEENSVALLFTDIVMPSGMNGRQLAHAALRLWPGTKILYTSGMAPDRR